MTSENTAKSFAIFGSQAISLGIRFLSNVILAWMLLPADFGVAAVVLTTIVGVALFSDVGIQDAIVRHEKGETEEFVSTAQTLSFLRGLIVYAVIFMLAPFFESYFSIDGLALYMRFAALHLVIGGLFSLRLIVQQRRLRVTPGIIIELVSQIGSTVIMVLLAYIYRNVWPLILSAVMAAVIRLVIGQIYRPSPLAIRSLNTGYVKEILTFGMWILFSTFFNYLIFSADRLILARISDVTLTGLYNLGIMLASIVYGIGIVLIGKLIYPLAAELSRASKSAGEIDDSIEKTLRGFMPIAAAGSMLLFVFSPLFFNVLYSDVYHISGMYSQFMVIVFWIMMLYWMLNMILTGFKRPGLAAGFAGVTAALRMVFCIWGYNNYGMQGFMAGLGLGSVLGISAIYCWIRFKAGLKMRYCFEVSAVLIGLVVIYYVLARTFADDLAMFQWVAAGVTTVGASLYLYRIYAQRGLAFIKTRMGKAE